MKRTFTLRRMLLTAILALFAFTSWAQSEKYSIYTQMLLDEEAQQAQLSPSRRAKAVQEAKADPDREYVTPFTADGVRYVSCFIHYKPNASLDAVRALGVKVECTFNGNVVTASVPVSAIPELAKLDEVTSIDVSPVEHFQTKTARQLTNVDDVLTHSADAVRAGLPNAYDGKGVIVGIIDGGIDFQHIAFKDSKGNSRIKRIYMGSGSSDGNSTYAEYKGLTYMQDGDEMDVETDSYTGDHGTHVAAIAGGSSVIVNGTTVTVTDNHANATYGGMAPGCDLLLGGTGDNMPHTTIANFFQRMCHYADSVGKPIVINNSWGSHYGPHDGTGDLANVVQQFFGEDQPNHICLFAATNDANHNGSSSGGLWIHKSNATESSPLGAIIETSGRSGNYRVYNGAIASAWSRNELTADSMTVKVYVINTNNRSILQTVTYVMTQKNSSSVISLSTSYFRGTLTAYSKNNGDGGSFSGSDKKRILLNASNLTARNRNYALAVEFYPSEDASADIDAWTPSSTCWFSRGTTISGHTWATPSNASSVSDVALIPEAISVGSYNSSTNANGSAGAISSFSGYQTSSAPTGEAQPWITAPGAPVISALNAYNTEGHDDVTVNSSTNPYGALGGTSMSTPVVSGIVALWLQAAQERGINLTNNDVKRIMAATAISASGTQFGPNGKIDALAGIKQIIGETADAYLGTDTTEVAVYASMGHTSKVRIKVQQRQLAEPVSVTVSYVGNAAGVFSAETTSIPAANGTTDLIVDFKPSRAGSFTGYITLGSGTQAKTVTIDGKAFTTNVASDPYLDIANAETIGQPSSLTRSYMTNLYAFTEGDDGSWLTMPAYVAYAEGKTLRNEWMQSNVVRPYQNYWNGSWDSDADSPIKGFSTYYRTRDGSHVWSIGYNSSSSYLQYANTYYVTNCTEAYCFGMDRIAEPFYIYAYPCTVNADGTVTPAEETEAEATNDATSASYGHVHLTGLDPSKVYMIVMGGGSNIMNEVGFKTPSKTPVVPTGITEISADGTAANAGLDETQPMYNVAGQRVGRGYHGIVVQKGKKFVVK